MDKNIMYGWKREVKRLKKQVVCNHPVVLPDVTGKTGICIQCGKTIRLK